MDIKLNAVIVIYNKDISSSMTYKSIRKAGCENKRIIVVDNSEIINKNKAYCEKNEIFYISMDGNKGLSKAYNAAIDVCKDEVIVLFDDDTEVAKEYFEVLQKALNSHPEVDIFAPIVYGQDGIIYSPNEFHFLRNHLIASKEEYVAQEKFNAIASCLAVRKRIFDRYRFNEILFVDQVDQNFFCEQRTRNAKFMKLEVAIHQNFYQRGNELSPEAGWRRLRLRIIDIMRHARLLGGKKYTVMGYIKCCGLGVQIAKKTKSLSIVLKAIGLGTKLLFRPQ